MYIAFLTTLINEITGLLPITLIQSNYVYIYKNGEIFENIKIQFFIALAFAFGNFVLYFLGKYGSIPVLKIFKKYNMFKNTKSIAVSTNFYWILLMRAIPFFPAKHVSIGLGILKYNLILFFISSFIGIFARGLILYILCIIGFKLLM